MSLRDHPGFFGMTSQGVIAIHADWPMYPEEHGPELALLWLSAFPRRTAFKCVDDIDQCCLLLADVRGSSHEDPFAEKNFRVAIWHEDLISLYKQGFIQGVEGTLTEREWQEQWRSTLPPGPYFFKRTDGTMQEFTLPRTSDYDDDFPYAARIAREGILVSGKGVAHVATLLANMSKDLSVFGERVPRLVQLGYYDTAVREASLGIESQIKNAIKSNSWGDTLANEFIAKLRIGDAFLESYLRVLRGQIRGALKFIRNDFMHNFVSIDETECRAILLRVVRVKLEIERVHRITH
jgi:hypothetical protein